MMTKSVLGVILLALALLFVLLLWEVASHSHRKHRNRDRAQDRLLKLAEHDAKRRYDADRSRIRGAVRDDLLA